MADDNPCLDEGDQFLVGFNAGIGSTRYRAPSTKQTCTGGAHAGGVLREASNVMTASSKHKVLTFGARWKNRTDLNFLNKDVTGKRKSGEMAYPGMSVDRKDAISTRRHSAPSYSTSTNTAVSSTAVSNCLLPSSVGASRASTGGAFGDSTYASKKRRAGAVGFRVGATRWLPSTGFGSISSEFEGVGESVPCLPDVNLNGVGLEMQASPAAPVESDFWAGGKTGHNIAEAFGDATPNVAPKELAYADIGGLMGDGGNRGPGASGNVAHGEEKENRALESLLLDDIDSHPDIGFDGSESCSELPLLKGSTANRLPQQQLPQTMGDKPVNPAIPLEVYTNVSMGAVSEVEPSDDPDRFSSSAESHPSSLKSLSESTGVAVGLYPSVWKLVERGEICPFKDCAFTVSAAGRKERTKLDRGGKGVGVASGLGLVGLVERQKNKSRCRHFHTLCGCRHTRGAFKGLLFQTNQLDKARNHQRKHVVEAAAAAAAAMPSSQYPGGTVEHNLSQFSQESGDYPDSSYADAVMSNGEGGSSSASVGCLGKRKAQTKIRTTNISGHSVGDGRRTWTSEESDRLREIMEREDVGKNWAWVAAKVGEVGEGRKTPSQCRMRWERILNPSVKRGPWTKAEDTKLKDIAGTLEYKWSRVAELMGGRTYKQCRERFMNYLKNGLNCGPWAAEENSILMEMHGKIGNKWAEIARILKDRSENMIKNQFMKLARERRNEMELRQDYHDGYHEGRRGKKRRSNARRLDINPED